MLYELGKHEEQHYRKKEIEVRFPNRQNCFLHLLSFSREQLSILMIKDENMVTQLSFGFKMLMVFIVFPID
jgi:hypothetical protein